MLYEVITNGATIPEGIGRKTQIGRELHPVAGMKQPPARSGFGGQHRVDGAGGTAPLAHGQDDGGGT